MGVDLARQHRVERIGTLTSLGLPRVEFARAHRQVFEVFRHGFRNKGAILGHRAGPGRLPRAPGPAAKGAG